MEQWKNVLAHVTWLGLLLSTFPLNAASQQTSNEGQNGEKHSTSSIAEMQTQSLPDSPGAVRVAEAREDGLPRQDGSGSAAQGSSGQQQAEAPPPPEANQAPTTGQKPVGTAAAETPNVSGIAASQPAGIAIAPAKQRRARTLVLRYGAIVGAAVAVGTIVALTAATPSKPPGAH